MSKENMDDGKKNGMPPLGPSQKSRQDQSATAWTNRETGSMHKSGGLLDSSFQTQKLNSSMNSELNSSEHTNPVQINGNMDSFNRYISNLIPNRAHKVVDNMMVKFGQFKDIIEKQINPNKYSLSEDEMQKLSISINDFDQYKQSIELEFKQYQDLKLKSGCFEDTLHDMHLTQNFKACQERVPSHFFLPNNGPDNIEEFRNPFTFFVGNLKTLSTLKEYQNNLVEYLDEVELNLFYQVYFRTKNYDSKMILKQLLFLNAIKVKQQLKKEESQNISKYEGAGVMKGLSQIRLYKQIEKNYMKVSQLKEQDYYADFIDGSSRYLRECLNFKEAQRKQQPVEYSIDISSIHSYMGHMHNDSTMIHMEQEEEIDENLQVFEWTHLECLPNKVTEEHMTRLYLRASHSYDMMRFEVFKNNIIKEVKKFQQVLACSFKEYCISLYRTHNNPIDFEGQSNTAGEGLEFLNEVNDILLMKFAQLYSQVIKSFLLREFSLLHVIKSLIIDESYKSNSTQIFWNQKVLPILVACTSLQIELLELMVNDLISYLKYTNTSTDANIAFKISTSNQIFEYWINSFPPLFEAYTQLDFSAAAELPPNVIQDINKANRDLLKTVDLNNQFAFQKSHLQLELFTSFHQKQFRILEFSLANDNWLPSNISYKIYSILDFFFLNKKKKRTLNDQESDDEEEEQEQFNQIRNKIIKGDSDEEEEEDLQDLNDYYIKKVEREYKIQLNKLIFEQEGRKFMLTEGFLIMLRQLKRYTDLMSESRNQFSGEQANKVISLIRFYNSYSREFLVGAKGTKCAQMNGKITVKNLAISSLNLTFLIKILPKIGEKLVENTGVTQQFMLKEISNLEKEINAHIFEIFATIVNIIKEMVHKSAPQISLLGWHKPQEKINVPLGQTARLVDNIRTMHNVLEEVLNAAELRSIFDGIIQTFSDIYLRAFSDVLNSPDSNRLSVQRLKDEVTYIVNEIIDIPITQYLSILLVFSKVVQLVLPLSALPKLQSLIQKPYDPSSSNLPASNNQQNNIDQEIERIAKKFSSPNQTQDSSLNNGSTIAAMSQPPNRDPTNGNLINPTHILQQQEDKEAEAVLKVERQAIN